MTVARNTVLGRRWTAGVRFSRPLPGRQILTAGTEMIDNVHQDQAGSVHRSVMPLFVTSRSSIQSAVYVQDEIPQNGRTLRLGLRWKIFSK